MQNGSNVILAIDPGDTQSAFCFVEAETYKPIYFAKEENTAAKQHMVDYVQKNNINRVVCEMVACYGMAVGANVFFTCVAIGQFKETFESIHCNFEYLYRKEEKMYICGQMKAKDSNIRTALIDRFAKFDKKNGKGTKDNPDFFFGFKADVWASYAVAVTWLDKQKDIVPEKTNANGEIQ